MPPPHHPMQAQLLHHLLISLASVALTHQMQTLLGEVEQEANRLAIVYILFDLTNVY